MSEHSSTTGYPVLKLTEEGYDTLLAFATTNPEKYLDPDTNFHDVLANLGLIKYTEESGVTSDQPIDLTPVTTGPPNRADQQALAFFHNLNGMTPARATDKLIWAWITHFRLHRYTLARWRRQANTDTSEYIAAHWFIPNRGNGLWNSNTASRTWWIAHTALKAANASAGAFTPQEALDHFASFAVHYHILARSSILRSTTLLSEFVRTLLNEAKGIKAEQGGLELFRRLNLTAGTKMLDLLSRSELRALIVKHVDQIMADPKSVADRKMIRNNAPSIRSLSLGAGVQSTVLALMADRGEYGLTKPDVAIFADTGWEPPSVYEHLDWLRTQISYEIVRVSAGNIRDNMLNGVNTDGNNYLTIPAFIINPDGTPLNRETPMHLQLQDQTNPPLPKATAGHSLWPKGSQGGLRRDMDGNQRR